MTRKTARAAALAAAVVLHPGTVALADPGREASLTFSQGVKWVDKRGADEADEGFFSTTRLDFGLRSLTAAQTLDLRVGTDLVQGSEDGLALDRGEARAAYEIRNRSSRLGVNLGYRNLDVEDSIFLDVLTGEDIIADSGRREVLNLGTILALGIDGPLSFQIDQRLSDVRYTDTTDPQLRDSSTRSVSAVTGLRINPVLSLEATAFWSDFEQDGPDGKSRTTRRVGLGGTYALSPITTVSAGVNYSTNETQESADDTDGLGFDLSVRHLRPNGAIDLSFASVQTVNGARSQLSLGRSFSMPRGQGSIALGASRTGDFDVEPVINASLSFQPDASSNLNLSLSQTSITSSENEEAISTQLAMSYSREMSERSRLRGGVRLSDRNVLGSDLADQTALRLDVGYALDVTRDWSLVSGYEHSRIDRPTTEDRRDDLLYLRLERTFAFRP